MKWQLKSFFMTRNFCADSSRHTTNIHDDDDGGKLNIFSNSSFVWVELCVCGGGWRNRKSKFFPISVCNFEKLIIENGKRMFSFILQFLVSSISPPQIRSTVHSIENYLSFKFLCYTRRRRRHTPEVKSGEVE